MDEARLISLARPTKSGVVSEKPCLVYAVCAIGLAQSSNVYTLHDGQSTAGDIIMRMAAGTYSADFRLFASPLFFAKGFYVDFTTNGEEVFIQFLELSR